MTNRTRNYSREDQRRYARRSADQGDRLRQLRGQTGDPDRRGWGDPHPENWAGRRSNELRFDEGHWDEMPRDIARDNDATLDYSYETEYDPVNNYWGERERARVYGVRGPVRDIPSARSTNTRRDAGRNDRNRDQANVWDDDEQYDFDPGFAYEFGTQYDFAPEIAPGQRDQNWDQRGPRQGRQNERRSQNAELWNIPGPYSGAGPRNYRRADERIRDDVCELFTRNGQLDASGLEIDVQDGEVTLRGEVRRRQEKRLAEDMASFVSGVRDVNNQIHVRPEK
jgi:hypothetical protein